MTASQAMLVLKGRADTQRLEPRKKEHFFHGEVFFLLTCPLMDDPSSSGYQLTINLMKR